MRVYVGELGEDGRHRVWVVHEGARIDLTEIVEVTAQLRALSDPLSSANLDRDGVIARKEAIIAQIEATASAPPPVELVHRGVHSPEGFAWGYAGSGPADLAQSILSIETGEDVGPELYLRFRDDVIARLPHRTHFRLAAGDVREWLSANRELVERSLFEQPPRAVVAGDPLAVAGIESELEPGVEGGFEAGPPSPADPEATASAVVLACEAAWQDIRRHHPELPDAVVILGSGVERGRLVKLGHWWGGRWLAGGEVRGEVLLAGEALHLPADKVFEVLLHEAAHGINAARGIKDTSRGGRYHNQRYADTAREVQLRVRATPPYGLADTSLTPESLDRYAGTIERLGEEIRIARKLDKGLGAGAEGQGAGEKGEGRDGDEGVGKSRSALAASCGCGRKLRMAPSVLARGPVVCGVCGSEFSTGAELAGPAGQAVVADGRPVGEGVDAAPAGDAEAAADRSFLDRRRAAVEGERRTSDLREVVARHRASLAFALSSADHPDHPALAPLRDRHARLGRIQDHLDGLVPDRPLGADAAAWQESADQAGAVRALVEADMSEARLAAWYEHLGTLRGEPMAAADAVEAERLTRMARTLLKADGTLRGPAVEIQGREFQAGDRVVVTAEVPGGPPAEAMGTVSEADPELGSVRVDFPTWGHVRVPLVSALAGSLTHDYAAVADPEQEIAPDPAVALELDRLGAGVEW